MTVAIFLVKEIAVMDCLICGEDLLELDGYKLGGFRLYHCANCGISQVRPVPSDAELKYYYSYLYELTKIDEKNIDVKPHKDTDLLFEIIRNYCLEPKNVAEVGCACGSLLYGLKKRGLLVKGFEISTTTSKIGKRKFGIEIETSVLPENYPEKFSVLIARHVLEHTVNPLYEIQKARNILDYGGLFIIIVPNFSGFFSKTLRRGWGWYCPPIHLFYFNLQSISTLLEKCGFSVEKSFTRRGDYDSIGLGFGLGLVRKIYRSLKKEPSGWWKGTGKGDAKEQGWNPLRLLRKVDEWGGKIFWSSLQKIIDRIGLGEELWIIAQKVEETSSDFDKVKCNYGRNV